MSCKSEVQVCVSFNNTGSRPLFDADTIYSLELPAGVAYHSRAGLTQELYTYASGPCNASAIGSCLTHYLLRVTDISLHLIDPSRQALRARLTLFSTGAVHAGLAMGVAAVATR